MENKYEEHVHAPKSVDELHDICQEYEYAGFPGCCGSVDGVHIPWYGFKAGARAEYVGKEKHPTLVFGVTVDHCYRIMHVTSAHAGATNDKFVIRADEYPNHAHINVQGLHIQFAGYTERRSETLQRVLCPL